MFNSRWQECSTVAGTIVQQRLARLFNSGWHNCSTVAGTIIEQSLDDCLIVTGTIVRQLLAWLFNSNGQDFFFFLCWQNSSTMMFTVEESCHVPGIRHMIPISKYLQFSVYKLSENVVGTRLTVNNKIGT